MRKLIASLKEVNEAEDGFTILELIVVSALLGVLAMIAVPVYGDLEENAQQTVQLTVASNAATEVAIGILQGTPADFTLDELNSRGDGYYYTASLADVPVTVTPPEIYNTTSDNVWVLAFRYDKTGIPGDWAYAGTAIGSGDIWSGSVGAPGGGILFPGA